MTRDLPPGIRAAIAHARTLLAAARERKDRPEAKDVEQLAADARAQREEGEAE